MVVDTIRLRRGTFNGLRTLRFLAFAAASKHYRAQVKTMLLG